MSIIYVVVLTYLKSLEEVDSQIPGHVEWLKKGYADGVFLHQEEESLVMVESYLRNATVLNH